MDAKPYQHIKSMVMTGCKLCAFAGAIALGGCAGGSANYPSVADIDTITQKILSPAERKKAIKDMTLENQELRAKTIESIEKG